jgi:hypothetical protein
MSRSYLALLSVVMLAACGESGQPLAPTTAPTARRGAAITETTNFDTPTHVKRFVPCANGGLGEPVVFEGTVHRLVHVTENENGYHVTFHANPRQVSGTGLITGDKYQARGEFTAHTNVGPGMTETVRDVFQLVGQGPNNNLTITFNEYHFTINANGELVVLNQEAFSVECT